MSLSITKKNIGLPLLETAPIKECQKMTDSV